MQIHLKKGEKLYVNGAVIRADHRCSLEFLNNVTFLLENHVMQADTGVDLDFLVGSSGDRVARESH